MDGVLVQNIKDEEEKPEEKREEKPKQETIKPKTKTVEKKKPEKKFRINIRFYELIVLYTTLLFLILAQWWSLSDEILSSTKSWLYYSLLLSITSLLLAILGYSIEIKKLKKFKICLSYFSLSSFFVSVFYLLISLWFLYKPEPFIIYDLLKYFYYYFSLDPIIIGILSSVFIVVIYMFIKELLKEKVKDRST